MTQEDIKLLTPTEWTAIPCTGTVLHILAVRNVEIQVRLGFSSSSEGMVMVPGDTLSVNETVYVKAKQLYLKNVPGVISVARD